MTLEFLMKCECKKSKVGIKHSIHVNTVNSTATLLSECPSVGNKRTFVNDFLLSYYVTFYLKYPIGVNVIARNSEMIQEGELTS